MMRPMSVLTTLSSFVIFITSLFQFSSNGMGRGFAYLGDNNCENSKSTSLRQPNVIDVKE